MFGAIPVVAISHKPEAMTEAEARAYAAQMYPAACHMFLAGGVVWFSDMIREARERDGRLSAERDMA